MINSRKKLFAQVAFTSDECGQCCHKIVSLEDGTVISNRLSGDWIYPEPNARWEAKSIMSPSFVESFLREEKQLLGNKFTEWANKHGIA